MWWRNRLSSEAVHILSEIVSERNFASRVLDLAAQIAGAGCPMDALELLNEGDPTPERVISAADRPYIWRLIALACSGFADVETGDRSHRVPA